MSESFTSLVDLCEKSCARFADGPLFGTKVGDSWEWITYGEFCRLVDRFRGGLASLGVGRGDTVGIISNNRVEWAVGCYATGGLGAAWVPMYEAQRPEDWRFILTDCGAKVCICADRRIYDHVLALKEQISTLEHVVCLEGPASDPHTYAALLKRGEEQPVEAYHPSGDEVAGLLYTSGTTGEPKGVILTHGNITSNINAVHQVFSFHPHDRSLSFLPWAHSFGQTAELHGLLSMGASIAINDEIPNLIANLPVVKPTLLFAVPRIFNRIYDGVNRQMAAKPAPIRALFHSAVDIATRKRRGERVTLLERIQLRIADRLIFSKVRQRFGGRLGFAVSGSAALSKDVAEFVDALGIEVYEGYGLTETSPIVTANFPGARRIGSVGRPLPGVRVVIDPSAAGDDRDGEIIVYGPNVMKGYHNRPEETADVLLPDGGFRTGDMGRLDDQGYLWITGRIKEQYKLENGKYVVPSPLEEELKLSPYIANAMIWGDNKPYNVVLVVPDREAAEAWAAERGKELDGIVDDPEFRQLIEEQVQQYSSRFKGYERPRKVALTLEDFTTDNGLLTPKLSLKRNLVVARYGELLEKLYA